MKNDDETFEVDDCEAIHETEKAVLIKLDDEEWWVPRSVICEDSEVANSGDEGTLTIKRWWAEKQGLA